MRLPVLAALSALFATSGFAQVEIKRVWPEYRQADSFERISEYFTHREHTSGQIVLRTKPDQREGYYFLVRFKNKGATVEDAQVDLNVIDPTSPEPRTYSFKTKLPAGSHVLNVGLTGADWAKVEMSPVAWEIRLLGADRQELARKQSFLWAKPALPKSP